MSKSSIDKTSMFHSKRDKVEHLHYVHKLTERERIFNHILIVSTLFYLIHRI